MTCGRWKCGCSPSCWPRKRPWSRPLCCCASSVAWSTCSCCAIAIRCLAAGRITLSSFYQILSTIFQNSWHIHMAAVFAYMRNSRQAVLCGTCVWLLSCAFYCASSTLFDYDSSQHLSWPVSPHWSYCWMSSRIPLPATRRWSTRWSRSSRSSTAAARQPPSSSLCPAGALLCTCCFSLLVGLLGLAQFC